MFYKFPNTSANDSSLVLVRNCCFACLIDCINSLLDIIFKVSLTLFQSSMLIMTDLGLPSGVVINSILGNSSVDGMLDTSFFFISYQIRRDLVKLSAKMKNTDNHPYKKYL